MSSGSVYVTQVPARREGASWVPTVDITAARDFGDIRLLVPSGMNQSTTDDAVYQMKAGLKEYTAEDYLLLLGDPVLIGAAVAVLAPRFTKLNLLKWDRKNMKYNLYVLRY